MLAVFFCLEFEHKSLRFSMIIVVRGSFSDGLVLGERGAGLIVFGRLIRRGAWSEGARRSRACRSIGVVLSTKVAL